MSERFTELPYSWSFGFGFGALTLLRRGVVIRTNHGPNKHVFPDDSTPYYVLITVLLLVGGREKKKGQFNKRDGKR